MRTIIAWFLFVVLATSTTAQRAKVDLASWSREEIAVGVILRTATTQLFDLPQSVSILEIDPRSGARLALGCPGGFAGTRAIGRKMQAVAAVNGGFFNLLGRSVGVLRVDGADLGTVHKNRTSGLVIDRQGRVGIETDREASFPRVRNVMTAGPLLVDKGKVSAAAGQWTKARHPRTAVGLRADGRILLLTIDGRTPASRGLSLRELAALMRDLGCERALNLDGGGSTTMWVRGEPELGIVNFPCDNRKHDHRGVRRVPNAVVVLARDVILGATDEAVLDPPAAWRTRRDGRGVHGKDWAFTEDKKAVARWRLPVDFTGEWDVEVWCPNAAKLTARARVRCAGLEARFDQTVHTGAWHRVGRIEVEEPGAIEVTLESVDGKPLAADAIRLVQRKRAN